MLLRCAGVVIVLVLASRVHAQPRVRFDVRGNCPAQQQVQVAFGARVVPAGPEEPAWSIEVQSATPGTATLVLRTPEVAVASTRTIESADCSALAEAFALIVLAHFAELHLLPEPEPAPESAPPPPLSARPPAEQTAQRPAPATGPVARAPVLALGIALGGGLELGIAPEAAAPAVELELALGPPRPGWLARFFAQTASPVQERSPTDRVARWSSGVRLEAGGRLTLVRGSWLAASAGGGVTFARIEALDLPGRPGTLRLWPALSASFVLGFQVARAWSLRWATGARLYPRTERYTVAPEGVVATSPRADLLSTVGLQFDMPL